MAIERVQFDIDSTIYTVPINPLEYDALEDFQYELKSTIDGTTIRYEPFFDSRPRTMTWKGLPNTSEFSEMIATLRSAVAKDGVLINHRGLNRRAVIDFWKAIRVESVEIIPTDVASSRAVSKLVLDVVLTFSYKRVYNNA